jgi:diguanylate cyclase (GGDEF)-like protein/PAS domain S-box-containing protein
MRNPPNAPHYQRLLEECAREQIHRPGSIQPTAVLIAVDEADGRVRVHSANVGEIIDCADAEVVGMPLSGVLGEDNAARLMAVDGLGTWRTSVVVDVRLPLRGDAMCRETTTASALVHRADGCLIVEIEPPSLGREVTAVPFDTQVRDSLHYLSVATDRAAYLQRVVDHVRQLTGFQRVMLYQFDHNWDGEVVFESRQENADSYLGHRFPAADIPPQARELYTRNPVRLIADTEDPPVALVPAQAPENADALDLSFSGCRSLSPLHVTYMRNMGMRASFSISLVQDGRLTGLIACHHDAARYLPLRMREFFAYLGNVVSLRLMHWDATERYALHEQVHWQLSRLTWMIRQGDDPATIVAQHGDLLLELARAPGGVLSVAGQLWTFGKTPDTGSLQAMLAWLESRDWTNNGVFVTDQLINDFPPAAAYQDLVSGLMAVRLVPGTTDCIAWFRPSVLKTVKWAGEPYKTPREAENASWLTPRESFETWVETFRDRSDAWSPLDREVAGAVALAITEVTSQAAIKASEEHYRLLAEHSTDMILRVNADGICTFSSPSCEEILGLSQQQVTGRPLDALVAAEDRETWRRSLDGVWQGEALDTSLTRFQHTSGDVVWIESLFRRVSDAELVINARDVTQRHLYQLAVEERYRQQARIMGHSSREGILSIDSGGRITYVNECLGLMIGCDPSQIVGEFCFDVLRLVDVYGMPYSREDCPLLVAMQARDSRQEKHGAIEHADGGRVEVAYVCTPLFDDDRVTGCVAVFGPAAVGHRDDRLQRAADVVLEEAEEAVMVTDAGGRIVSVNRAFSRITGYSREEAVGQTPRMLRSGVHTPNFYADLWASLVDEGRWMGEIWNRRKNGELYPQWGSITVVLDADGSPLNYVAVFSDNSKAKQDEEQLYHLANHDALTDLPNRLQFNEHLSKTLERAKRGGYKVAVVFLDLDRFKIINDSLGHQVGDAYLRMIAERLEHVVRSEDFLARWGGDEFLLIYEDARGESKVVDIVSRIMRVLAEPLELAGHEFVPTASIGISFYPDDARTGHDLIRAADTAMYRAKQKGRNNFQFYTGQLTEEVARQLDMTAEVRRAIGNDEFELLYQPQMDAHSHEVVGVEALIRWNHPVRGLLSPADFLPAARELGLMRDIGSWVLRAACAQSRRWCDGQPRRPRVAINIDPAQLTADFPTVVAAVVKRAGVEPRMLELEITEGALRRDDTVLRVLHELDDLGCTLSVDDFGTGYSSLSHVRLFPISTLKIDKSFVDGVPGDHRDVAIIHAIVALGKSLGIDVIAEGIENDAQQACVVDAGANLVQGYLFSQPVPASIIDKMLSEFRGHC